MNLTTESSIDEIVNAINNVSYPSRPTKPSLSAYGKNPTPDAFRHHASLLEAYEREEEVYKAKKAEYTAEVNRLQALFVDKLRVESVLSPSMFDIVYSKAYEDGHSGGYHEVASKFDELESFAMQILKDAVTVKR